MTIQTNSIRESVLKEVKEIKSILNRLLEAQNDDQNRQTLERIKAKQQKQA